MGIGSIGILSTWRTVCGIANFTADSTPVSQRLGHQADIVPIDRDSLRHLARRELGAAFDDLAEQLLRSTSSTFSTSSVSSWAPTG